MRNVSQKHLLASIAMLTAAGLAVAMAPNRNLADTRPEIDLNTLIPKQFGDWRVDKAIVPIAPSPDIQATLKKTYTQTLSRTYVNDKGERIMLSIAYSRVSHDGLTTHVPEICYPSQGFRIHNVHEEKVRTRFGTIPVKRLVATRWSRIEPITYWMILGNRVVVQGWPWRLIQIRYGLHGVIPDDMLVRVSNIGSDSRRAYSLHNDFIQALLDALSKEARSRFTGTLRST